MDVTPGERLILLNFYTIISDDSYKRNISQLISGLNDIAHAVNRKWKFF
jgi:hypothetical protein